MALRYTHRLLRQRVWGQLVGRRVLPFTGAVGRLAVLLRGDHLMLAANPKAGQHELFDLPALGLCPGWRRARLKVPHAAAPNHTPHESMRNGGSACTRPMRL